jgi:hypothetical protein
VTDLFASISGEPVAYVMAHVPRYGAWLSEVECTGPLELSGVVTITIGDLSMVGTIIEGGVDNGVGRYRIVGGNEWNTIVPALSYQSDTGVQLQTVIKDLARECGAGVVLPSDQLLGETFVHAAGIARQALATIRDLFGVPWWPDVDGKTVFGPREYAAIGFDVVVSKRNMTHGIAYISPETFLPFLPGCIFEGKIVRRTIFRARAKRNIVELWS